MFKNPLRFLSLLNKVLYNESRLILRNTSECRQLLFTPVTVTCRTYCTSESKTKVTPSSTIISSFVQNQKDAPEQQKPDQNEDEEGKKQRESSWRTMKYTLLAFGMSFGSLGAYLVYEFGKPPVDPDGALITDEYSHLPTYKQYVYRTLRELDYYKKLIKEPSREKLLPDVMKPPYYQPPYTLVLEMTDVLVHPDWTYQTGWRFKKRPGIERFLETLSGMYEIVIFTAEQGMTVFPIIEALDPNNIISYKLVRDATHFVDGHHVKDLSKLNRDLNKVIVIDWNMKSVKFHRDNLLLVQRWDGNDSDNSLVDLISFLKTIASSEVEDVREVLRYYNQFDDPLATFREKQQQLIEKQELERIAQEQKSVPVVKRWAPSLTKKQL